MIQTILIPLDGLEFSERALPIGIELGCALHARIVLVCVAGTDLALPHNLTDQDRRAISEQYAGVREEEHLLSTSPGMVERAQEQIRSVAEAERYLQGKAAQVARDDLQVEVAVPYGAADEGILTEIDLHSADLVIMATHARTGLNRLIGGSVAAAVLAHSPVPIIFVPPER